MVVQMMWFKREPKPVSEKSVEKSEKENGKVRKKKSSLLKPTRESSERETSAESDKERRRYSDILDMKVSLERRDESDESLYESADGHSDAISASDDAMPRLGKTPTISKESLKLAITDEEAENRFKKTHRKAISLSNPLEMVKNLGDEWFEPRKKDLDKHSEKKKSRESLWSEEDRDSIHGSTTILDQIRKNSKKEDKSQSNSRKNSNTDAPKTRKTSKGSSVGSFNFLRRKKTPTSSKPVEVVPEDVAKVLSIEEILNFTKLFLEEEQRYCSIEIEAKEVKPPPIETDTEDEAPVSKPITEHRRRLSRQTSRSKSKARGKSQSLKVNTLRKSHSGTLKKGKKKTPSMGRIRQNSIVEQTPNAKKKNADSSKHNSWLFSASRGESRREGSNDEPPAPDAEVDASDAATKEPDKDSNWRTPSGGRGVNRAESCRDRERELPRRGKHRNASDPNRLTAHNNHDLEPGGPTAPSGSSSSSSLSSRSNESNTVPAEQHASQSDWSEDDDPLATQWADSIPPHVVEGLSLSPRLRKRQEVIHELIVSEGSHLRWLKVLGGVFLRPLENAPSLLPPEELRALFPNLPSVKERHSKLYGELRALRTDADAPLVDIRAVADAMLNTLGDSGYASCLSKFCRGQRMALECLRERRRKNKELHSFLSSREQLPLCGRLQLRDLLACVWQRLTKYQLLLESVVKTVQESDCEREEDVARLNRALTVAKDVLHGVDTAIRTAENEHRLRAIQSKLEVRAPSAPEWEELRRLELTAHSLRCEGDLAIKNDNNKKIHVLALMLEEYLVLIHREGDRFVLKPISQSSQQHLSPLIKWDKVLFRPNAAVRNTFFLMNINGVQMHELSANSAPEYTTWLKHIQDAPLAKLTEVKPNITPSHQATRSADDSGINVSRNPSDASEKSEKSHSTIEDESERDRTSAERSSIERERDNNIEVEEERSKERSVDKEIIREEKEDLEKEDKHKPRRPTEGRIVTHALQAAPALEPSEALQVAPPAALHAATAVRAYTHQERLRRLDEIISRSLRAKSAIVAELLHVPIADHAQLADLAVADALGQVDVRQELRRARGLSRSDSVEEDAGTPNMHQLLLAACTQANQLTTLVRQYLNVDESSVVAARARCDSCAAGRSSHSESVPQDASVLEADPLAGLLDTSAEGDSSSCDPLDASHLLDSTASGSHLARQMLNASVNIQHTLSLVLAATPPPNDALREELVVLRERNDALRGRPSHEYQSTEEIAFTKASADSTKQDLPSNGG